MSLQIIAVDVLPSLKPQAADTAAKVRATFAGLFGHDRTTAMVDRLRLVGDRLRVDHDLMLALSGRILAAILAPDRATYLSALIAVGCDLSEAGCDLEESSDAIAAELCELSGGNAEILARVKAWRALGSNAP